LENDHRSSRGGLRHKIAVDNLKRATIGHPNRKRAKRLLVERRFELLGGHISILAGLPYERKLSSTPRLEQVTLFRIGFVHSP
jgi:hypothetical protein